MAETRTVPRELFDSDPDARLSVIHTLAGHLPARNSRAEPWVDAVVDLIHLLAGEVSDEDITEQWQRIDAAGAAEEWFDAIAVGLEER